MVHTHTEFTPGCEQCEALKTERARELFGSFTRRPDVAPLPIIKATSAAKKHAVHHSSNTDEWPTPPDFFAALDREFSFTLDAAATPENAKCPRFYTQQDDALKQDWKGNSVWLNPPYSRPLMKKFMAKASAAAQEGATVVMLIPNRPNSAWFQFVFEKIEPENPASKVVTRSGVEFRPIAQRLKFGTATTGAPFPSAVVIFYPPGDRRAPR